MKKGFSNKMWAIIFISPFLICFFIFWLLPLILGVIFSLFDWSISAGNQGFVGLDNYKALFTEGNVYHDKFFNAFGNTIKFVLLSVGPLMLISLGLALLIDNLPKKLKSTYRTIFFISYSVSVTAVSAIFLWLFNSNGGFVNNLLMQFNIISVPINWLGEQPTAWIVILVATVWWTIGFNMMLFINALDEVDVTLYEAAGLDGANSWKKFFYVTMPQIRNVFFFILIMTIIASFNLYGQTKLITAGGPEQSTASLIMAIQDTVLQANQLGMASAMAIIMGIIMMLITGTQYWIAYRKED